MKFTTYTNADRKSNKIALTFDDGPNPFYTIKVLNLLERHKVKGNFFILGKYAEKYPEILKEIFDRGHLIGNHTYSHPRDGDGDFEKSEEIIFNILGTHTQFIRPPYFNIDLCNSYHSAISATSKVIINYVYPLDWKNTCENIVNIINQETQNGSIIALHDGSDKEGDLECRPKEMFKALPEVIKNLKMKFQFARLDEMSFKSTK